MVKKIPLRSLKNGSKSQYQVRASVRHKGRIVSLKRVVEGPKWKAEACEVELKRKLRKQLDMAFEFISFSDVLDYYEEEHLQYTKSYKKCFTYVHRLRNDLGTLGISEVTTERFRRYLRDEFRGVRRKELKNATRKRSLMFAKAALNFAVENNKIREHMLKHTKRISLPEEERNRVLSDDEWARLEAAMPAWLLPIIKFAYLVPTRTGELKALRRDWIDGSKIWLPGSRTKTGHPRYLPIPPEMQPYFDSIPRESDYCFYRMVKGKCLPIKEIRLQSNAFGTAVQEAGLRDFRPHDLRHTAATNLRRRGVRIEVIMAIGGWKTMPTFFRYSNYTDAELIGAYV